VIIKKNSEIPKKQQSIFEIDRIYLEILNIKTFPTTTFIARENRNTKKYA